jgi:hypothetical protein
MMIDIHASPALANLDWYPTIDEQYRIRLKRN